MANTTKFYVFEVISTEANAQPNFNLKEIIPAESVSVPRKKVSADFPDGRYVILADTSGIVTKTSKTVTETSIAFDAPRKERKPKTAAAAPKPEAKKTTPPAGKPGVQP